MVGGLVRLLCSTAMARLFGLGTMKNNKRRTKLMWDWPVRIMHWSVVVLFFVLWWTAENEQMDFHRYAGYGILALLIWRVYWGFAGSTTARFSHFVKSPAATWQYAKHLSKPQSARSFGHNPLGAYSVILLLLLLSAQIVLGLFAIDVDGWEAGPLNAYVSFETGRWCATWHEYLFNLLLAWVVLHVLAISFYFFVGKHNLLLPMIDGKTVIASSQTIQVAHKKHYLIVAIFVAVVLYFIV